MFIRPDGEVMFSPECPHAGEMANGFVLGPAMVGLVVEGRAGGPLPDKDTAVLGIVFRDPVSGAEGGVQLAQTQELVRCRDVPPNFSANVLGCIALCKGPLRDGTCGALDAHKLGNLLRPQ